MPTAMPLVMLAAGFILGILAGVGTRRRRRKSPCLVIVKVKAVESESWQS
jgi:LPXTG-motif cell wall-anchored protein